MNAFEIIGGILLLLSSIFIVLLVVAQESRQGGMGALSGSSDSFLSKTKGRTLDVMLSRWTKIAAIVFFVLTLVVNIVAVFVK